MALRRGLAGLARAGGGAGGAGRPRLMVLGIESSCDETAAAVVDARGAVLGEALASSAALHAEWGGVVPSLARMAHEEAIDGVVAEALRVAGAAPGDLAAVAATKGPGLGLCLRVGMAKALGLSHAHRLPFIPVHHMEAHALTARLCGLGPAPAGADAAGAGGGGGGGPVEFPFVALLVSGGHNLLLLVEGVGRYTQLGTTLDDAVGEAFDKSARLLGLDLAGGGGPALERLAREGDPAAVAFPVPLQKRATCDFSYAGLKTAVRLKVDELLGGAPPAEGNRQVRADIAASFQRAAVLHLAQRTRRGLGWARELRPEARQLVVAGGVAANQAVRAALDEVAEGAGFALTCPPPQLCTDNGVMVAWAGMERLRLGLGVQPPADFAPGPDDHIELFPRWPLGEPDPRTAVPGKRARSLKSKRLRPSLTADTLVELRLLDDLAGDLPVLLPREKDGEPEAVV